MQPLKSSFVLKLMVEYIEFALKVARGLVSYRPSLGHAMPCHLSVDFQFHIVELSQALKSLLPGQFLSNLGVFST